MDDRLLLVTGASGFVGWRVCLAARDRGWRTVGAYGRRPVAAPGIEFVTVDWTDVIAATAWLDRVAPTAIIHCAAAARPNWCEEHPAAAAAINVDATIRLAAWAAARSVPLVFASTDLVFDGTRSPYHERDRRSPICVYGRQKVQAETEILRIYGHHQAQGAAICRLPLMYGPRSPTAGCFFQDCAAQLGAGEPVRAFVDEFRTPAAVTDVAAALVRVADRGQTGTLHLGGPERLSRYALVQRLAEALGYDRALVQPGSLAEVAGGAPRSPDTALDSTAARHAIGYAPAAATVEHLRALLDAPNAI